MKNTLKKWFSGLLALGILSAHTHTLLADGAGSSGGGWPIYARTLFEEIKFNLAMDILSVEQNDWLETISEYLQEDQIFKKRDLTKEEQSQAILFERLIFEPSNLAGIIYNMKILDNQEFQKSADNGHEFYFRISDKDEGFSRVNCIVKSCGYKVGNHPINLGITTEKRAYSPFYNSLKSEHVDSKVKKLLRVKLLHEVAHLWGADDERAEQFAEKFHSILKYSDARKIKCVPGSNNKICTGEYAYNTRVGEYGSGDYIHKILEIYNNGTVVLEEPYVANIGSAHKIVKAILIVSSNQLKSGSDCLKLSNLGKTSHFPVIKICKNQTFDKSKTIELLKYTGCSVIIKTEYGYENFGNELIKKNGFEIVTGALLKEVLSTKISGYALEVGAFYLGIKVKDTNGKNIYGQLNCSKELWGGYYLERPFSYLFEKRPGADQD